MLRRLRAARACASASTSAATPAPARAVRDTFVDEDRAVRAEVDQRRSRTTSTSRSTESKLEDASLKGIVESLHDPLLALLHAQGGKAFDAVDLTGEFEGVGMSVEKDKRGLRVLSVFDGSPAKQAGIRQRDLIMAVNGRSIAGAQQRPRDRPHQGQGRHLSSSTVVTPGAPTPRSVRVKRERITVPVATGRLVERGRPEARRRAACRVQLGRPRARCAHAGRQAARRGRPGHRARPARQRRRAARRGRARVEHLRRGRQIVSDRRAATRPEAHATTPTGDAIDPNIPVVVLVDGGSASASEIVTGALRDRHRATVVGTQHLRQGRLVQEVEPLSNGGALDLTVGELLPAERQDDHHERASSPRCRAVDNPRTKRDEALARRARRCAAKM